MPRVARDLPIVNLDLNKYPDVEGRTPREVFTAKLRKFCTSLSKSPRCSLTYKYWPNDRHRETSTVQMGGLWVFGSYARGALTCGDLDVLVDFETVLGAPPRTNLVAKACFGVHPNVRFYGGTPEQNFSGITPEKAVLVWAPGKDWEAALDAIAPDPSAGRFARPSDQVPVRAEQLKKGPEELGDFVRLRDEGVLAWRFIGLSELVQRAYEPPVGRARDFDAFCRRSADKRRLAILVFGLARELARQRGLPDEVTYRSHSPNVVQAGSVQVHVVNPDFGTRSLDTPACSTVAFVPALSTRGPNGAWVIERGPNHPLVRAFADVGLWALVGADGCCGGTRFGGVASDGSRVEVRGVEVFDSAEAAQEFEHEMADCGAVQYPLTPRYFKGAEALDLLRGAEVVHPNNGAAFGLTAHGQAYCAAVGEDPAPVPLAQLAHRLMHPKTTEEFA